MFRFGRIIILLGKLEYAHIIFFEKKKLADNHQALIDWLPPTIFDLMDLATFGDYYIMKLS